MTETRLLNEIRKVATSSGARLFRNNVGVATYPGGAKVVYGLADGSSDLIGWTPIMITPEMVGQTLAVFTSIEVKKPGWKPLASDKTWQGQKKWLRAVKDAGGIAALCRSVEEAIAALCEKPSGTARVGRGKGGTPSCR